MAEPILDHVFRHHYGRLTASLTRVFGIDCLDLVEDVVQEAMLKAMRSWSFHGVPDEPEAWITRVAQNLALDVIRHRKLAASKADEVAALAATRAEANDKLPAPDEVADDTLRMIFTCCHPALPAESRVALTLKTLCGFGAREIASALLTKESTIAQRLTRAKAKLQREVVEFKVPSAGELDARLDSVLEILYLMFNEGYRAHRGTDLVREELVHEAIRLAELLTKMIETDRPKVHALLALMLLLGSRIPARLDACGELLTLAEQDRTLWNRAWIDAGMREFERSIGGDSVSAFHVEAAIASLHAFAADYDATDWTAILRRYDELCAIADSPVVRLNRAIAIAKVQGTRAALTELERLADDPVLTAYPLFEVTRAHLLWHEDDTEAAAHAYRAALQLGCTDPERALVLRRLEACENGAPPPAF